MMNAEHRNLPSIGALRPMRLRRDLIWTLSDNQSGDRTWIAEDPLSRKLFRCGDHEYQLLQWLEHTTSIEQLAIRFHQEFAPRTISLGAIRSLIDRCVAGGLVRISPIMVASSQPDDVLELHEPPKSKVPPTQQRPLQSLAAVRWIAKNLQFLTHAQWSLGNPDSALERIQRASAWIYASWAVKIWLMLAGLATALIVSSWDRFVSELPSFQLLRSPGLLVGYGVVFVATRIAHELGHAVVCKRSRASCRDVGLLMSYGMLCPYVDITDAWRIGNRFQRMWIALAGMYTELIIATVAAFIWFGTHPGWLHDLTFQVMLVCSLTTLLFNANPLMKYDGYFAMCDWLNMQNLRDRAFRSFDSLFDSHRRRDSAIITFLLSTYLIASTINRIVLTVGVIGLVYWIASQWQLAGVGIALIVVSLLCSFVLNLASWAREYPNKGSIGARAQWLGWCCVGCLLAWAINIPIPNRIHSVGYTTIGEQTPIYATKTGIVLEGLDANGPTPVSEHAVLLRQNDHVLERAILELEAKWITLDQRFQTLSRKEYFQPDPMDSLRLLAAQRKIVEQQLAEKRKELSQLTISARTHGLFIPVEAAMPPRAEPPTNVATLTRDMAARASTWNSPSSKGRILVEGTLIGFIRSGNKISIDCAMSEEERVGIEKGLEARIRLNQFPERVWQGHVADLSRANVDLSNRGVSNLEMETASASHSKYRLRIALDEVYDEGLYENGTAEVVILRPNRTLLREATDFWLRNARMR